jgi:hypothetical protein
VWNRTSPIYSQQISPTFTPLPLDFCPIKLSQICAVQGFSSQNLSLSSSGSAAFYANSPRLSKNPGSLANNPTQSPPDSPPAIRSRSTIYPHFFRKFPYSVSQNKATPRTPPRIYQWFITFSSGGLLYFEKLKDTWCDVNSDLRPNYATLQTLKSYSRCYRDIHFQILGGSRGWFGVALFWETL